MSADTDLDLVFRNAVGKKVTLNIEEPKAHVQDSGYINLILLGVLTNMTEKQIIKLMKFPLTDQGNAERLHVIEWLTRSQAICHCERTVKYFREMVREENENKSIHNNA